MQNKIKEYIENVIENQYIINDKIKTKTNNFCICDLTGGSKLWHPK